MQCVSPARDHRLAFLARLALAGVFSASLGAWAATLPTGFREVLLASGLDSPTAIEVLPDGRILIAQQQGAVLIISEDGSARSTLLALGVVNWQGERGLLGIVASPDFASNGLVFLYYTSNDGGLHDRLSRFQVQGGPPVGGETVLADFDGFQTAIFHMGGAMRFAADGALLIGVGDHTNRDAAQDLGSDFGKVHRFAPDGSIPPDNPYANSGGGTRRSIWARGLRNPYSLEYDADREELLINDVGENTWEEINLGAPGANYGWPDSEGYGVGAGETAPLYAYNHQGGACAIIGGAAYPEHGGSFPEEYRGRYLYADFCAGWIRSLQRGSGEVAAFATGLAFPTALRLDAQGRLLYLARGTEAGSGSGQGKLYRIEYEVDPALLPQIVAQPEDTLTGVGESAEFRVEAAQADRYQWQRDGANLPGENATVLELADVALADDGARFRVVVGNAYGTVTSAEAILSVTTNRAPVVTIASPLGGSGFEPGAELELRGSAVDPEEGAVPVERLTWRIDLHHDAHVHPLVPPTSGLAEWLYPTPDVEHGTGLVWIEVLLRASDAAGRTGEISAHVFPFDALLGTDPYVLALREGAYLVSLEFQNPLSGAPQNALRWSLARESGGFWFFGEDNLEVLLKVIDGTATNGCQWVFAGSLSDVEYDYFVVETASGGLAHFANPLGTQASGGDIEVFCNGTAVIPLLSGLEQPTTPELALLGGRFRLTVEWASPWSGESGVAQAVPLSDESGLFTFFAPSNLEMAVKMVDGVAYNGHYWVYWTALSNLETLLTVEDLWSDRIRSFPKPGLAFGAGADILAFPAE